MRPRSAPPEKHDETSRQLALRCEQHLKDHVSDIGVCILQGVAHTWGDCPYAPSIDGVIPPAGSTHIRVPASHIYTLEQCVACAANLRPGGRIPRWLDQQLDPYLAWEEARDQEVHTHDAIRRMVPTGMLGIEAIRKLLDTTEHASVGEGTVILLHRPGIPAQHAHTLRQGEHHPDGWSIISTPAAPDMNALRGARAAVLATKTGRTEAAHTARTALALRQGWKGRTEDLWPTALALT